MRRVSTHAVDGSVSALQCSSVASGVRGVRVEGVGGVGWALWSVGGVGLGLSEWDDSGKQISVVAKSYDLSRVDRFGPTWKSSRSLLGSDLVRIVLRCVQKSEREFKDYL